MIAFLVRSEDHIARTAWSSSRRAAIRSRAGCCNWRLLNENTPAGVRAICCARPTAESSRRSGSSMSWTSPAERAWDGSSSAAVSTSREAAGPIAYRRISTAAGGNGTPTLSSARPIVPRDISRRSHAAASTQPPAIAWPLIAATTGPG